MVTDAQGSSLKVRPQRCRRARGQPERRPHRRAGVHGRITSPGKWVIWLAMLSLLLSAQGITPDKGGLWRARINHKGKRCEKRGGRGSVREAVCMSATSGVSHQGRSQHP